MARRLTLFAALCALLALTATAQAATIWTPINSGTTSTISSIVYQSPTRFWYATTSGTIASWNGSAFVNGTGITPGENFTDLAFQPGGGVGYAVTSSGHVWRSTNAGASWAQLPTPSTPADCTSASPVAESELNAVQWANTTTVYLLGNNSTVIRSLNADAVSPTFAEVNKVGSGTCAIQQETFTENFTDATFLPTNPADAFFVAQDFGRLYGSSNALSGSASGTKVNGDTVNSFNGNPRIAQDANNANRLWIVDHQSGGAGCGTLCLQVSTDGGADASTARFPNDATVAGGLYDISSQGGVEVTAGSGGEIFTSVDGTNFYNQPADGALATENWRAEAAYDAMHAAVGGENGALAITAAANTIPNIAPPVGPISGPTPGKATPPGPPTGSKPATTHTGQATIKIYRIVTVTGRTARFVPVIVSASKPRKFTVQILPLKGRHPLASSRLTLKGRHGGHGILRVKLPAKVKPGSYYIVVRVAALNGRRVGRVIKFKFALR